MKRQPISKSVRFSVFRRDGFQCLYCGRRPPDVMLQVDHAMPVSVGGDSAFSNLVTCCSDCNQGKRDKVVVTPFEWEDSELQRLEAEQRLAELRALQRIKQELDRELVAVAQQLASHWHEVVARDWDPALDDIRYLLDDHDQAEIEKAFYLASRQSTGGSEDAWRYACAVLRNWKSQAAASARKG